MKRARIAKIAAVVSAATVMTAPISMSATAAVKKAPHKFVIGWSDIYLTPSWMQETLKMLQDDAKKWEKKGVLEKLTVANANGDTSLQISQIQNMISQHYDAILVDAGSSTALNPVIQRAMKAGIVVVNFDSLVTTNDITSKISPDQKQWGVLTAKWLVNKLHGKGKIVAINGPAGVAVSDDRWAGAESVFSHYPKIQIVANVHSEYNVGPALQAILPVLQAHKDINGVYSQGGALSAAALQAMQQLHMKLLPTPGENYNGFLKAWAANQKKGFSSFAPAQPNWLSVLALEQAIRALQGYKVKQNVVVPLPIITDKNLKDYVPNKFPDDYYPIKPLTQKQINQILGPLKK